MKLKDLPYWKQGGIIGILVYTLFVIFILTIYRPFFDTCGDMGCSSFWIFLISGPPASFLFILGPIAFIVVILQYFLIGALIGLIYEKIRKKY